jgi:hypothetical protein
MIKWRLLSDEEARQLWDVKLESFADCSPYQTHGWGEYRRALGWQPCRWAAFDEAGEVVAMMQGALRRYLSFGLVWSEGGPVGDLSVCDESLQSAIKETTGLKLVYCRFRCDRERDIEDVLQLNAQGWSIPWAPMFSSYSMSLDLLKDEESLLASADIRWRQNLRRAAKQKLTVKQWLDADPDQILSVYLSMQAVKGLEEQHSREEIAQVIEHLNERLVLYRCDDEHGELVSLGGSFVIGTRAGNWFAATNEGGRKLRASYLIFWSLIQHCKKAGVRFYDLAGIDPVRNPGVYRFKRGSGARHIEYLGEWDWASHSLCRWFGNWAIARRTRISEAAATLKTTGAVSARPARVAAAGVRAVLSLFAAASHLVE